MAARPGITVKGLDKALARLRKVSERAQSMFPVFVAAGMRLNALVATEAAAGRGPTGRPWAKRRVEPEDGHPLLRRTGALLAGVSAVPREGGIVITSAAPYARYVERGWRPGGRAGGERGQRRIPGRPLLPFLGKSLAAPKIGPGAEWWRQLLRDMAKWVSASDSPQDRASGLTR